MNQEIKTKWVEAFRSGKYRQGQGQLRTFEGDYCCLGVLCDVVDPELWNRSFHDGNQGQPSNRVLEKTALNGGVCNRLISMNDRGVVFACIADYIEENL